MPRANINDTESTDRRQVLAGIILGVGALSSAPSALAGPLENLKEMKLRSNAKFLLGPIRLSRDRLMDMAALLDGDNPRFTEARSALKPATLDCVAPSAALQQFASVRDVCTYSIVYRSVTRGPAVKNSEDGPLATEARESLIALISAQKSLDAVLESGENGSPDAKAAVTPAFTKVFELLDRFELAIMRCLGFEADLDMVLA